MGKFRNTEEAREYFRGDKFATNSGMILDELSDEHSVCSMELGEGHRNANGGIMGGVIFTLADLAFAALANNVHMPTVAQQVSINYLSAPHGRHLTATAHLKRSGRSSTIINVDVTDGEGRDVAQFTGTGFKL